jgi:predicted  nucleic acid-binding Zn-ribbon protein
MTKNLYVSEGHFMFWPCKCGHVYGRHGGELFSGRMMGCFECGCKKFFPAQSLETWRKSVKGKRELSLSEKMQGEKQNEKV